MTGKPASLKPVPPAAELPPSHEAPAAPPRFPVVGIGASAGGLAALDAFFSGMPAGVDPGMAFVVVQHLAPDHKSLLVELIGRQTRMHVFEAEDGMVVQINCVYVIPPGHDLALLHGALQLLEPHQPRGHRLPIDFFFLCLSQDVRERAICVVLSGTGSDGSLGARAIKGEGGLVVAQAPASAEFDGMPRSVLATGLVDYELPPAEMAAQLIAYATHGKRPLSSDPDVDGALNKVFVLLRAHTGHDFSLYKPSTIGRRIQRRMAVHGIEQINAYVRYLERDPAEIDALFRDLLIGVTSFFRDPDAFQVLEDRVIPRLFDDKGPGSVIRVWVPGCSTGEEAYSIAILLIERMEAIGARCTAQVFATDIDPRAIVTARAGRYPTNIASDVSPERLTRFFTLDATGTSYRINKSVRDLLVFSEQDVVRDPPFSKVDLISCRNLLIYMGVELQRKLNPLFHYALNTDGWLFLGTSEDVGGLDGRFSVFDCKAKVFRRESAPHGERRKDFGRSLPKMTVWDASTHIDLKEGSVPPGQQSLREATEGALLSHLIAAGVLVNREGDILYLHGRTGMFLEPSPGEAGVNNILKMAREGLHRALTSSLRKVASTGEVVACPGLRVKTNGHFTTVNLTVRAVPAGPGAPPESPWYLVILQEVAAPAVASPAPEGSGEGLAPGPRSAASPDANARIAALNGTLRATEDYVAGLQEELKLTTEQLSSSKEEMQSVNEELQSSNEELETSKEEMQSINEELGTVNAELNAKVAELSEASDDLNNLLSGTGIATVFVDHQLHILRFTPAATSLINLIPADLGRPLAHIVSNLVGYNRLVPDLKSVLATLLPREVLVQTVEGSKYLMRIQAYRTQKNVIEGAVISFLDVTEIEATREALRKANDAARLAVVVRDSLDAITVQDLDGRILAWNAGAVRLYGWTEAEALGMNVRDRIPAPLREAALATLVSLGRATVLEAYRTQRLAKGGAVVEVSIISTALIDEAGMCFGIATTERATLGSTP